MSQTPQGSLIQGDKAWCPRCETYTEWISFQRAARIAGVSLRTIYNYIEEGKIHAPKIAGATRRVCAKCLLDPKGG